jgi:glutathione-regulated potassium-efflux system ancillary protein KefC
MDSQGFLYNLVIYLSAAVVAVPVFSRLGLGSVLGYLVAGICIGPWGLGFIGNVSDILHFAEIGVVLLLFLIGLELEPTKLWGMRRSILGAGGMQAVLTSGVIFLIAYLYGIQWEMALVIGLGLSLSSTAIALQTMNERRLLTAPVGRTGFSILLFQDISVIPILALISLLASDAVASAQDQNDVSPLIMFSVMVAIFVVGRYALRHIFRFVASTRAPEIFTALSLLLVAGIATIMNWLGISMALGAFLAGVILADSEYRHALESDIQPFKGLLLGLFFISVGMSIDFGLLLEYPLLILAATVLLVLVKSIILYIISLIGRIPKSQRLLFTSLLSQSGEFGFVLFGFAVTVNAMGQEMADLLILVVAISMVITPLLLILNDRYIEPRYISTLDLPPMDDIEDENNPVILVGFGRFGQVVGRLLHANRIGTTVIDHDPDHIERVRRFGYKTYYGDVLRHDVMKSVGASNAQLIILATNGKETINQAVDIINKECPDIMIVARAYDRPHALELLDKGVEGVIRESFYSAVEMSKKSLDLLGFDRSRIDRMAETYIRHDVDTLNEQLLNLHDEKAIISIAKNAREQLEKTLEADLREESREETL